MTTISPTLGHRTGNVANAWSKTSQNLCAMMEQERVSQNLVVCCTRVKYITHIWLILMVNVGKFLYTIQELFVVLLMEEIPLSPGVKCEPVEMVSSLYLSLFGGEGV